LWKYVIFSGQSTLYEPSVPDEDSQQSQSLIDNPLDGNSNFLPNSIVIDAMPGNFEDPGTPFFENSDLPQMDIVTGDDGQHYAVPKGSIPDSNMYTVHVVKDDEELKRYAEVLQQPVGSINVPRAPDKAASTDAHVDEGNEVEEEDESDSDEVDDETQNESRSESTIEVTEALKVAIIKSIWRTFKHISVCKYIKMF